MEPPSHVPANWVDCACGVPCQLKEWKGSHSYRCWKEDGTGCKFVRGVEPPPDKLHTSCVICGEDPTTPQCSVTPESPIGSVRSSQPSMDTTPAKHRKIQGRSLFSDSTIPVTMYVNETSVVVIVKKGVTGIAGPNSVAFKYETPSLVPADETLGVNEHGFSPGEKKIHERTITLPVSIDVVTPPKKETKGNYLILSFPRFVSGMAF